MPLTDYYSKIAEKSQFGKQPGASAQCFLPGYKEKGGKECYNTTHCRGGITGGELIDSTGEIKDMEVPWLFQDLKVAKKTCAVVFEKDRLVKTVYFKDGDPLFASSNNDNERLGEFLLRQGRITQAQFEAASATVIKTKKKLGAVLFEMGLLSPKALVEQVKLQIKHIILELFGWREGRYRIDERALSSDDIIPLQMQTAPLILEGMQALDWQSIRKYLPPLNARLYSLTGQPIIFQHTDLTEDQKNVLSLIDGGKTVEEICVLSGIGDFNALKAIYLLCALQMAGVGERKSEKEMTAARQGAARSAREAAEPKTEEAVTRQLILKAFEDMKRQDDFQVLGVNNTMPPEELKKVYFKLAKRYHPDRHLDPDMADLKETLEALFSRVHDAYERISGSDRKDEQRQFEEKRAEDYVENYAEKMRRAVAFFNEGMKDFKVGNFWGAADQFSSATRFDPVNAAYFYYLGMSLMNIPRRRHEAEENLQKAIAIDPLKPEYYLQLGALYLKSGLNSKALDVYIAALRDNPYSEKIKEAIQAAGGSVPKGNEESAGLFKKLFQEKK